MKLTFIGATNTVTGSKYLLEIEQKKILIDCGLFQGLKELRLRNWAELPFNPKTLDAVVLTHAHIDHSGYLPLLVKHGFTGPIYATPGTVDLCQILLLDSGHLQEEDARRANVYGYSKHQPALPLYTKHDAEIALKQFQAVDFDTWLPLQGVCDVRWRHAGHIIGAASIEIKHNESSFLFSGDLGRLHDSIMKSPAQVEGADYVVVESTYGNRLHDKTDPLQLIAKVVNETVSRGGTVLIPAFAVGRSQMMLYFLYQLRQKNLIPPVPVYLDSPMAIDATALLLKYRDEHQLTEDQCRLVCSLATYTQTPEQSMAIDNDKSPKIIISASGMMTGGRVLHHLKHLVTDAKNTILMTGFQAEGTRGARLLNQEPEIKIHGETFEVKAQVASITNASAHADYEDILTWLGQFTKKPKKVFITHGEKTAAMALQQHIQAKLGWSCVVPDYKEVFNETSR